MTAPASPPRAARRAPRRGVARAVSSVLVVAGVLLLADAGVTAAWQEPVSAVYATVQQHRLGGRLDALGARALVARPGGSRSTAFAARAVADRAKPGDPVGRLRIPAIGVSQVVVEGTAARDLRRGPGHYGGTPLPGAPGTVAVAGHRTTYGAPFRDLDELRRGDRIVAEMPYATVAYRVERLRVVAPTATWVVARRRYDRLVLTACDPLYSAARRLVVFARQVAAHPSAARS